MMETEFKQSFTFKYAKLPFGKIETNEDGSVLRIFTEEFDLIINNHLVNLGWKIHRPHHDHDDHPYLVLKLPESGKIMEGGENARLNLHFKGDYPQVLHHGIEIYEVNVVTGEKKLCRWRDGDWRVVDE